MKLGDMVRGWRCPFCIQGASLRTEDRFYGNVSFDQGNKHGQHSLSINVVVCPTCKEFVLNLSLHRPPTEAEKNVYLLSRRKVPSSVYVKSWQLVPAGKASGFPDYVPQAIRDDYSEAYAIKDLSPKAAATLARRCMQGMIRDYWKIKQRNLAKAIDKLKGKVDGATWDAVDGIRKIGNIGAHMEKDINVIVDVEPNEVELLLKVIEDWIEDWYIASHERNERLAAIKILSESKEGERKASTGEPPRAEAHLPNDPEPEQV